MNLIYIPVYIHSLLNENKKYTQLKCRKRFSNALQVLSIVVYLTQSQEIVHCRWNTYVVDGHNVAELCKTLHDGSTVKGKPTAIIAKTFKGKGCGPG